MKKMSKLLLSIGASALLMSTASAEELTAVNYYDCGYDSANPSKCFLYMPTAKLLATHTAGTLDDYEQATGVEATFDNGTLTLPDTIDGLTDASFLQGKVESIDFYYIQQNANGAGGSPMFFLYSPNLNLLQQHEAGKLGADNVEDVKDNYPDFSFDPLTGKAQTEGGSTTPTVETPPTTGDLPKPQ
jgi:hypothetical protein